MGLIIDGKRLIPAPLVTLGKTYSITGDGRTLSPSFEISLGGTLLPNKGSPSSTGSWYTSSGFPADESLTTSDTKFNSILRKQDTLRELFINPGVLLEYGPNDGSPAVLARVKLRTINFEPGVWVDRCNYTITLEAEDVTKQGTAAEDEGDFTDLYITQASENFSITEAEDGTGVISITQTISAVGKASYSNVDTLVGNVEPWENAKTWVLTQADNNIVSHLVDTTSKTKYNKRSSETIDKWAGSYSLSIVYTIHPTDAAYVDNYDISTTTSRSQLDDLDEGQLLFDSITITGTVIGLDSDGSSAADRLVAARDGFNTDILPNINSRLGLDSGHLYVSKTIGESTSAGSLTYSFAFTNYPNDETTTHIFSISDNKNSGGVSQAVVNGTIQGLTQAGDISDAFAAANSLWNTIKSTLSTTVSTIVNYSLVGTPSAVTLNFDKSNARVNYTVSYNYVNDDNAAGANYFDQYEVTLNDLNNKNNSAVNKNATISVNGSLVGFSFDGSSNERYAAALSRWNTIKSQLKTRAATVLPIAQIADRILSKIEGHSKANGVITYNYTFSLRTDISNEDIINEEVSIETINPKDVYAVQIIPGLATGPILQNINTVTEARKTLTVNFTLDTSANVSVADARFEELEDVYEPATTNKFVENNSTSYNPNTGLYSKTKTWVYKG